MFYFLFYFFVRNFDSYVARFLITSDHGGLVVDIRAAVNGLLERSISGCGSHRVTWVHILYSNCASTAVYSFVLPLFLTSLTYNTAVSRENKSFVANGNMAVKLETIEMA